MTPTTTEREAVRQNQADAQARLPCEWEGGTCMTRERLRLAVKDAANRPRGRKNEHQYATALGAFMGHHCGPVPILTMRDITEHVFTICEIHHKAVRADDARHDPELGAAFRKLDRMVHRYATQYGAAIGDTV